MTGHTVVPPSPPNRLFQLARLQPQGARPRRSAWEGEPVPPGSLVRRKAYDKHILAARRLAYRRSAACVADVAWLLFIFLHSLRSADQSMQESHVVVGAVQQALPVAKEDWFETFLRKGAHFAEFFVLGCLFWLTVVVFAKVEGRFRRWMAPVALAGLVAGLLDETLQLTSPGRCAQVPDVWLDWVGYLCGAFLLALITGLVAQSRRRVQK